MSCSSPNASYVLGSEPGPEQRYTVGAFSLGIWYDRPSSIYCCIFLRLFVERICFA